MILIPRDAAQPAALAAACATHQPRLQRMHAEGKRIVSDDIKWYAPAGVYEALRTAQHSKCCYCEKELEDHHEPIEHHRPKAEAKRHPGSTEEHGYWWLAHTWENLFAVCWRCNGEKGTQFPLAAGSVALAVGEQPPGRERPLLINPAEIDGTLHICFEAVRIDGDTEWIPRPRNNSLLGEWTIRVCKLGRGSLRTAYKKHVKDAVRPRVDCLQKALRSKDPREVQHAHSTARRALLNRDQRFVGLSLDALRHFIPDPTLAPYRLSWRPPA